MAEAYETEAFEEIYKHPDWKIEADQFETDFTKALYDDEAVKKEGQAALVHVSNVLIAYNQIDRVKEDVHGIHSNKRNEIEDSIKKVEEQLKKIEAKEKKTPEDEELKKHLDKAMADAKKRLDDLEKEENEAYAQGLSEASIKDDEGQILSSLMLGGTGIGGQGYTITDNSIQDTRKGAQYIREQMTEKGTLLDQMALLDNAMNTGGIDLEGGTDFETRKKVKKKRKREEGEEGEGEEVEVEEEEVTNHHIDFYSGENMRKKTLNDMFRDKNSMNIGLTSNKVAQDGRGINHMALEEFQKLNDEEQNNIIGDEGLGENRQAIMDVAGTREATEEARNRKKDKKWLKPFSVEEEEQKRKAAQPKQTGIKGVWQSVKNFFTGGDKPKPFEIDYDNLSDRHKYMLMRQGLDPATVKDKYRMGMTEAQKRVLDRIKYEQRKEMRDKKAQERGLLKGSEKLNKDDTSDKLDGIMKDRDKQIGRELNEKNFLTTEDAEKVVKDPKAETGRLMNSPKTARNMLAMYRFLTTDEKILFNFRLALLAYLVPTRRNTIYEVLSQSHEAGVKGKEDLTDPVLMYESIYPYTKDEIRAKLPGKKRFPHEKVFLTMLDEYRDERDEGRGTKKEDRKDLVNNQKNMTIAEVARELLNPASGLALFAKLRLLTDESITDDDIKKHIDRLTPEEQNLVNEFMEKLAREQKISYEDLQKWIREDIQKTDEMDQQINAKQTELNKIMRDLTDAMRNSSAFDGKRSKELDRQSREVENELKDLQDKKDKYVKDKDNEEKRKDFKERGEWRNERQDQAITAVGKIRNDLFHLLTAAPTAYETTAEAANPALRKRLLVITRLANRFLLDSFEGETPLEDTYKFKEYQPNREEVYQSAVKEEAEGTLGMSKEEQEAKKREEEEKKARIEAEKELRKSLAARCVTTTASVKDDERLLPEGLEDTKRVDTAAVGRAINRVVNTYLNFDPAAAQSVPDTDFPDMIPRLLRYNMAAAQIKALLSKRPDANGAVSEENLQKVRRALKMREPIEEFLNRRSAVFTNKMFGNYTKEEFEEKLRSIREKNGEGFSQEELMMYEAVQDANASGEALASASADRKEEVAPGTESGQTYLDSLKELRTNLVTTGVEDGNNEEQYNNIIGHLDNLITALSGTFNAKTDIGGEAAGIAKIFSALDVSATGYLAADDADEKRSALVEKVYGIANGMLYKFGQASYRTVEILSKNNLFQKGEHLWARVMVLGAPLIKDGDIEGKLTSRPTLKDADLHLTNEEMEMHREILDPISKDMSEKEKTREDKTLSRFRALLGSADMNQMKQTLETYKRWDQEDAEAQKNKRKHEKELIDSLEEPEKKEEPPKQEEEAPKQEPPKEEKPLEEQEIDRILEEQENANIEAKEGEENAFIGSLRGYQSSLDKQKTGFLGLFADKKRNGELLELRNSIENFISLASKTVLPMEMEEGEITNEDDLNQEYVTQITALYKRAHMIKQYAFHRTGSYRGSDDEKADPFKTLCRSIYDRFKLFEQVCNNMLTTSPAVVIKSNVGADADHEKELRNDISSYAKKQNLEGKLRYIFFLMRGLMTKGETGYAAPKKKWLTRAALEKQMKANPPKAPVVPQGNGNVPPVKEEAPPPVNDDDFDDYDILNQTLDEEDYNRLLKRDSDDDEKELNKLENELKDGEYEDENDEHEMTEEQKENAKKEARRLAREEAEALKKQREAARSQVVLPEYKPVRARRKKSKDDFLLTGGREEENPEGADEQIIEQQAVKDRNFTPARGLRTRDKIAKIAGWALFGIPHYVGKPVKWIGGGIVHGVNFALRWVKKKVSGGTTQKTAKNATQETQDKISEEIDNVKKGFSDQQILSDTSRVPMNWEMETAGDPNQAPSVTVGVVAPENKEMTEFGTAGHTWMQLAFSREDPRTGKKVRNKIDVGFGPRGGFGMAGVKGAVLNGGAQAAQGQIVPGALWDERDQSAAAQKTYPATNRQINQMLLEAERYPAGGFNLFTRNCTNFVADVTQRSGVNTGDIIQMTPLRIGATYLTVPLLSLISPLTKLVSGTYNSGKTEKEDLSFARFGEKQLTEDEQKRMDKDNGVHTEVFDPSATLGSIQEQGGELQSLGDNLSEDDLKDIPNRVIKANGFKVFEKLTNLNAGDAADKFTAMADRAATDYQVCQGLFKTATPEAIVELQKMFSRNIKEANDFFYKECGGNPQLRVAFLHYIGALNQVKKLFDIAFQEARKRELHSEFEESDVSEQLKMLTSGNAMNYRLHVGEDTKAVFTSPALMIGFAQRGTSVEQTYEMQEKNKKKNKLLMALQSNIDADASRIWQKESFSDDDVDLAFDTMQTQQQGISHFKEDTEADYDFTGAEVMQALIFERIYGGMKGRINAGNWFVRPQGAEDLSPDECDKRSDVFANWVEQDMEISAKSHPMEVAQIEKSIAKRLGLNPEELDANGREQIKKEYHKRVVESYLVPLFVQTIHKKFGKNQYYSALNSVNIKFGID